jgi:hypothetical protein
MKKFLWVLGTAIACYLFYLTMIWGYSWDWESNPYIQTVNIKDIGILTSPHYWTVWYYTDPSSCKFWTAVLSVFATILTSFGIYQDLD